MVDDETLDKIILDSVIELKPPSKLREILTWYILSFVGGIGLGVLICFLR